MTPTINGTGNALANIINGNDGANQLFGGGGNDTLDGNDGNDVLDGGDGNDTINGGDDNDTIIGGAGNDTIDVGGGFNTHRLQRDQLRRRHHQQLRRCRRHAATQDRIDLSALGYHGGEFRDPGVRLRQSGANTLITVRDAALAFNRHDPGQRRHQRQLSTSPTSPWQRRPASTDQRHGDSRPTPSTERPLPTRSMALAETTRQWRSAATTSSTATRVQTPSTAATATTR